MPKTSAGPNSGRPIRNRLSAGLSRGLCAGLCAWFAIFCLGLAAPVVAHAATAAASEVKKDVDKGAAKASAKVSTKGDAGSNVDFAAIPELPSGLLVDAAGGLSEAERDALSARLRTIQASERGQVAIFVAAGLRGEPLADFSLRVAEAWGLGRVGHNDGLLILVIPSANAARIEVGYGLEGAIPDARASQWLDDLLPAVRQNELATGLNRLLDQVEAALPAVETKPVSERQPYLLDAHPEWTLPFVLLLSSIFAVFPVFAGRWGCAASAILLAGIFGGAAWTVWESQAVALAVAGAVLPFPILWGLNFRSDDSLAPWQRLLKVIGNLVAVVYFFCVVTMFVGVGLSVEGTVELWVAPIFAGVLAIGVAVFLFPGKSARYLMNVLRSVVHFVFLLAVAYFALLPFARSPTGIAFAVAGAVTAMIALALYLDSRQGTPAPGARSANPWSLALIGLALTIALPLALSALVLAVLGAEAQNQLAQAVMGGGSLVGILWLAARLGLFAAVKVGLGGLFGGGGAGRGG